jgi:hypothetical protein
VHQHFEKITAVVRYVEEFERALWAGRYPEWGEGVSNPIMGTERLYRCTVLKAASPETTFGLEWKAQIKWIDDPPSVTNILTVFIGQAKDAPLVETIRLMPKSAHFTRAYRGDLEGLAAPALWRRGMRDLVKRMGAELPRSYEDASGIRSFECPCPTERHVQVAEGIGFLLMDELAKLPLPHGA